MSILDKLTRKESASRLELNTIAHPELAREILSAVLEESKGQKTKHIRFKSEDEAVDRMIRISKMQPGDVFYVHGRGGQRFVFIQFEQPSGRLVSYTR